MYNRYQDIEKFITDCGELKIENGSEVYISREENYDIVFDLGNQIDEFEKMKSIIVFLAENICELDNTVQRFERLYNKNTQFPFDLKVVSIDKPNIIKLEYWGSWENTSFYVVFEYQDTKFVLKRVGLRDIPADWDQEI